MAPSATLVVIMVTSGALVGVPGSAPPASADITRDIANARSELSALSEKTEAAAEAFNEGRIRLAAARSASAAAQERVRRAKAALAQIADRHRDLASAAYGQSGLEQLSVLLSGDPQTALDRAGAIDALARRQRASQRRLALAEHDLSEAEAAARKALDVEKAQTDRLAARKRAIEASAARQQALLKKLLDRQAELVRQQRAREAAARRAAERAAAAARLRAALAEQAALSQQAQALGGAGAGFAVMPLTGSSSAVTVSTRFGGASVAVAAALSQLGKPYVWGAAGPNSFDCSGLTMWAWARAGVALNHYTGDQWNQGTRVSRDQLRAGDLVFFGSDVHHVGMYLGGGRMVDAPRTGLPVRVEPVWWNQFHGAVRPGG